MSRYLLVAAGAAVGGVSRYAMAGWLQARVGPTFPLGTLAVNVLGCAAIGALSGPGLRIPLDDEARALLVVGLLGGFTTFSAFGFESYALLTGGRPSAAAANVALNVGLGLAAVGAGRLATRALLGG